MGCVRWTAPERLRGGPSTERTDVFAWAMTMLEVRRFSLHLSLSKRASKD